MQISIQLGKPDRDGKQTVVAKHNGIKHVDHINTLDAYRRKVCGETFADKVLADQPYCPDAGGYESQKADIVRAVDAEIIRKAEEAATEDSEPSQSPVLICMADVEPRQINWYWQNRIPAGRLTLLVGRPGEGKSFATIYMAANTTTGTPFPDGAKCQKGSVLLLTAEDDPGDTIRPRLDAHHADCSKVHMLSAVRGIGAEGEYERLISLADVDAIETTLKQLSDCRLVIVDPIGSFLGGKTDAHRDNEVRSVLAPIAKLAEKYGPAVVVVAHRRKAQGATADDLALGSRAFTGIARAVWHISRDPKSKQRRLMLPGKNNLAAEGTGLAFSIIGEPASVQWERDPVDMSADDSLAAEQAASKPGPDAEAQQEAIDFLHKRLFDGPVLTKDVEAEAKANAISISTLRRARKQLNVKATRPVCPGPWYLALPGKAFTLERLQELERLERLEHVQDSSGINIPTKSYGVLGAQDAQDAESQYDDDYGHLEPQEF